MKLYLRWLLLGLAAFGGGAASTQLGAAGEPAAPKRVALIFDDGPQPCDAGPLLEILAQEKIPATFAFIGKNAVAHPDTARAVLAAGHEVVNHSQTHAPLKDLTEAEVGLEVTEVQANLTSILGSEHAPKWYWPPFLAVDDRLKSAVKSAGLQLYTPRHLVVSRDYDRSVSADEIFRLATTDVRDGSVILFHEWRAETREKLPAILAELRKQRVQFLTFSGLEASFVSASVSPAPRVAGSVAVGSGPTLLTEIPAGGVPLLAAEVAGNFAGTGNAGNQDAFKFSIVEARALGFKKAFRMETTRDLSPAWAVEARVKIPQAVRAGETGFLRFFARTLNSTDETGAGQVRVVVQQAGPDYRKSLEKTVTIGAEWIEFRMPFTFADSYAADGLELVFGFGFKRETVEIGGIELLNFAKTLTPDALPKTRFSYAGREPDAAWRQAALARIEQIRKSDFLIEIRDAAGQPVPGAVVKVEQRRSAFHFGTALQLGRLVTDSPENQLYREKALELFNAGSPENDLKWPVWIGEWKGNYSQDQSLRGLRWMRENGLHTRGHVLVWPGWKNLPELVKKQRGSKKKEAVIPDLVIKHIADITGATRDYVQEWDVLNEPYDNHDLMGLFGADIMVNWFKAAEQGAAAGVPLYLNDYSNHDLIADKAHCADFFKVAKFLKEKGAPLGGLGLQGHISAQPNAPENVLAALQVYSELNLPIRITEFDIDTEDEQLQADYTRDFLILAYSHPSVVGVQHWGFWEKAHWRPRGALFRADWSEKPAAKVYRALVLNQWRTRLQGKVGKTAKVSGRGFHGDYVVTVEHEGERVEHTFTLKPDEPKTRVQVTLP